MRHFGLLLLIIITIASVTRPASAQELQFRGNDIVSLARVIAAEAKRSSRLPSAYQMPMENGRTMIITNANAFELLARSIVAWRDNKTFPSGVFLLLHDLVGPALDTQYEPKRDGLTIAMPVKDLETFAPSWLAMAEAPGHKLLRGMTFESGYRLSAAQILVAMATLVDESMTKKQFPVALIVPLARSPQNWNETRGAIQVAPTASQPIPQETLIIVQPDLRITLNGIEMTDRGPVVMGKTLPPFCGSIRIEMAGAGPVAGVRLLLADRVLRTYQGIGPHVYLLDTLQLPDGIHTISITATDTQGKNYAYIFSFSVMNGRQSGFSPMEREVRQMDVEPMPAQP